MDYDLRAFFQHRNMPHTSVPKSRSDIAAASAASGKTAMLGVKSSGIVVGPCSVII